MTEFFEKYGGVIITLVAGIMSIFMLLLVFNSSSTTSTGGSVMSVVDVGLAQETTGKDAEVDYEPAQINFTVENAIVKKNTKFDWKDYVTVSIDGVAKDSYKKYVQPLTSVNTSRSGNHECKLQLNWNGKSIVKTMTVFVRNK